jgi:hypothetical protein
VSLANVLGGENPQPLPEVETYVCAECADEYPVAEDGVEIRQNAGGERICESCREEEQTRPGHVEPEATEPHEGPLHG